MRVSSLAASLGVATAVLLGGATGASATTTSAPSLATQATHNRGGGFGDCGRDGFGFGDGFGRDGFGFGGGFGRGEFGCGHGFGRDGFGFGRGFGFGFGDCGCHGFGRGGFGRGEFGRF
jgi:hypothetical protein